MTEILSEVSEVIVVLVSCPVDSDAALTIARTLVERHLVACVNQIPGITSTYWWEEQVQQGNEALLLMKTTQDRFDAVKAAILSLHPYTVPEIIALPVVAGSEPYLTWLMESVRVKS